MFHMMNEARIGVGLGAVMLGIAGYEACLGYARERTQGRPIGLGAGKDATQPPVPIIEHADVKRMLLAQKAGAKARSRWACTARGWSTRPHTGDAAAAAEARLLLEVLTPIAKSWPSEWCLEANSLAIQVLGGYGYTRDFPVEQYWRDNRLNMIHEGTHGIQALDLLGRKVVMQDGGGLGCWPPSAARSARARRRRAGRATPRRWPRRCSSCAPPAAWATGEPDDALANATPYMQAFGHLVLAWMWLDVALAHARASPRRAGGTRRKATTPPWRCAAQARRRALLLRLRAAARRRLAGAGGDARRHLPQMEDARSELPGPHRLRPRKRRGASSARRAPPGRRAAGRGGAAAAASGFAVRPPAPAPVPGPASRRPRRRTRRAGRTSADAVAAASPGRATLPSPPAHVSRRRSPRPRRRACQIRARVRHARCRFRGSATAAAAAAASPAPPHAASRDAPDVPYAFPDYDSAAAIDAACSALLADLKRREAALAAMSPRDGAAVPAALDAVQRRIGDTIGPLAVLVAVHPDKALRDAAERCDLAVGAFDAAFRQNARVHSVLRRVRPADGIDRAYLRREIEQFEDAGGALAPAARERARAISLDLTRQTQPFERRLRENRTRVAFAADELRGVPEAVWKDAPREPKAACCSASTIRPWVR